MSGHRAEQQTRWKQCGVVVLEKNLKIVVGFVARSFNKNWDMRIENDN